MKTQHKTKKAGGSQRIPQNFAIGAKVEDIYTGKISTVSKIYWQNYAGGNTSDYTVEFAEGGWNKSQNLKASVAPESDVKRMKLTPDEIAYGKFYNAIEVNKKASVSQKSRTYATHKGERVEVIGQDSSDKSRALILSSRGFTSYVPKSELQKASVTPESDAEGRDQEFGPNWREHFPAEAQGKPELPMTWTTDGRWIKELQAQRDDYKAHAEALAEALRRIIRDDDLAAMRHAETMLANWEGVK